MNLPCRWEILFIGLWIQVGFVPGIHCKDGPVNHLSREDVLLLKNEPDPKCFTWTEEDFTCFFETADNGTYDLLYNFYREKICKMSVQRTEEGTFLHICSFPTSDVFLFVAIHLEVVEPKTNTILYNRTVSVEDHVLLDPPYSVSLHQNGQAGQLQVSWYTNVSKYWKGYLMYRIRYFSERLGEMIKEAKEDDLLDSLEPGEDVEVRVAVKYALNPNAGHWSSWSHPVRAVVPQSAGDISLECYTSDLHNISCQWNGNRYSGDNEYKLFHKMGFSEALGWTEWTECLADRDLTELCRFRGDKFRKVRVKLTSTSAPLGRTFFTEEFSLNNSIKTSPPCHLRGALEKDKYCLKWKAPLLSLSAHLQYEVSYKTRGAESWMTVSLKGPETGSCLDVPAGSWYYVKVRAKPTSSIYSGHWSDWSDVLTVNNPTDIDTLFWVCIPVLMLIIAIILICLFPKYLSKLKLYVWPPVPNLDKVLQGFLTEINGQRWDPPITAKQCPEEITSSVVEILSEDEVSGLGKPSEGFTQLLSPERCQREQVDGSCGTKVFPDYVTLNKNSVLVCTKGNKYVYKEVGDKGGQGESNVLVQTCLGSCTDGPVLTTPCLGSDFLNHSYLPLAGPADRFDCKVPVARGPGNLYTNFPCI
ncbi:thrombopoietin receptor [Etheostoma cragini]|uniref:thrombopoietin receptor n=1 Tax=Etheostoma cragini TaxID=417921 RepID=UPI00155E677B|nr:thrombopoietin receptor [Etheostoma cragini]